MIMDLNVMGTYSVIYVIKNKIIKSESPWKQYLLTCWSLSSIAVQPVSTKFCSINSATSATLFSLSTRLQLAA